MKELSIEEKAKRYDEALKEAVIAHKDEDRHLKATLERIFPELKESKDERIIERIKKAVESYWSDEPLDEILAWLEKKGEQKRLDFPYVTGWRENRLDNKPQIKHSVLMLTTHGVAEGEWLGEEWCQYRLSCKVKDADVLYWLYLSDLESLEKENFEQKPADKVEPKFIKVEKDKWYVCISQYFNCIEGRNYKATSDGRIIDDYGTEYDMHSDTYKWFRHWTIKDAKDGDVLAWDDSKCIALFKNIYDEDSFNSYGFIGGCTGTFESRQSYHDIEGSHPATKEQRDLLFHKMHESGYEWDAEKKELIKIEQKPAWSEEDEEIYRKCICAMRASACGFPEEEKFVEQVDNWFKSLKARYTWKPSDEQMKALKDALNDAIFQYNFKGSMIKEEVTRKHAETIESLYNDLKKL